MKDLKNISIHKEILESVPARIAHRYAIIPFERAGNILRLAVSEETPRSMREELQVVLGASLEFLPLPRRDIENLIYQHYGIGANVIEVLSQEVKEEEGSSEHEVVDENKKEDLTISRLVNELFLDALAKRASDIHIEPFEHSLRIRYRIDGLLEEAKVSEQIRYLAPNLISRIKIMARLDIGEKRLAQDGRILIGHQGKDLDLRVSVLPSCYGEAIVIRILKPLELLKLGELGFREDSILMLRKQLKKTHGVILITGPTGSGKTTTLYACLKELNQIERKIITIEDPIEYKLPGIIQMQMNPKTGFTFSSALRSMLRHDPDCLMVGEIRDPETAEIVIRSSLTGHLVLSTIHTNDAASAVTRLVEMGIEPYLVASSLQAVIAQRLVRKRCHPCAQCDQSGFYGRTVVYELLVVNESIREAILQKKPSSWISRLAAEGGMRTLAEEAKLKIQEGMTSFEEFGKVYSEV